MPVNSLHLPVVHIKCVIITCYFLPKDDRECKNIILLGDMLSNFGIIIPITKSLNKLLNKD